MTDNTLTIILSSCNLVIGGALVMGVISIRIRQGRVDWGGVFFATACLLAGAAGQYAGAA